MQNSTTGDLMVLQNDTKTYYAHTNSAGSYTYYQSPFQTWPNYYYQYVGVADKGSKAYEIVKKLQEKKLVDLRTAKSFTDLMDAIMETL